MGIIFADFMYSTFESNKKRNHLVVFVTLFATNFIGVQQCKKARSKFCGIFVGGNLFSRDSIITDREEIREIRDN